MGKQEANIYEIAREAGVSIATVSRVINHSNAVSEKSYRRVMDAVRQVQLRPQQHGPFAQHLDLDVHRRRHPGYQQPVLLPAARGHHPGGR